MIQVHSGMTQESISQRLDLVKKQERATVFSSMDNFENTHSNSGINTKRSAN